jgi:hypothetical protein
MEQFTNYMFLDSIQKVKGRNLTPECTKKAKIV